MMISFNGYDDVIQNVNDNNQGHVFNFWEELSDDEKKNLLEELKTVDFNLIKKLFAEKDIHEVLDYEPSPFIKIPETEEEKKAYSEAKKTGENYIRKGKVAAFVVAGGQGSRLGYDGPKGKFPVGPVSNKTLFQIHTEKIVKYSKKYNTKIPFLIMTSNVNHDETVEYFKENNNFGLTSDDVIIFKQNMIPSLDSSGNLILKDKSSLFMNPDGHGGSLTALYTSGTLDILEKRGIETISYFQVDNPLVNLVDPVFIGFHVDRGVKISSKALKKAYPEEKVGVFVRFSNNRIGVVEYSDLPDDKAELKNNSGDLQYSAGSIAIHFFDRQFIQSITSGKEASLPFHTAKKKIKSFEKNGVNEIDGLKFEKFVFDALPMTEDNLVFETIREFEFAPVKNPSGVDSVESSIKLMDSLFRSWIKGRGIQIPGKCTMIEISPLVAVDMDDLDSGLEIPDKEKVYLE